MLDSPQARALQDQILAAYRDDDEASVETFVRLFDQASALMNEHDYTVLGQALSQEQARLDKSSHPVFSRQNQALRTRISILLECKPQDCWVGVYWKRQASAFHVWICLLPTLPIHVQIFKGVSI